MDMPIKHLSPGPTDFGLKRRYCALNEDAISGIYAVGMRYGLAFPATVRLLIDEALTQRDHDAASLQAIQRQADGR